MTRALVDTSAWIDFYHPRGSPEVKRLVTQALEDGEVAVTAPVVAELLAGARTEEENRTLQEGLQSLHVLPLAWEEGVTAGRLAQALARTGRRVPVVDLLIAAAAHSHGYEIWHAGDEHYAAIAAAGGPPERNLRPAARR
ncbi:MAG: PIN domain-containing protein [Armatimonadetes bacterium]|nr:PIN domain-containing protein [Armatimonadota bacterium]